MTQPNAIQPNTSPTRQRGISPASVTPTAPPPDTAPLTLTDACALAAEIHHDPVLSGRLAVIAIGRFRSPVECCTPAGADLPWGLSVTDGTSPCVVWNRAELSAVIAKLAPPAPAPTPSRPPARHAPEKQLDLF